MALAACYPNFELASSPPQSRHPPAPHKDFSRPLHVDCSVEYELPNQAKPPEGAPSEPLLMIHPCYYRRAESQRRSPFINNLPTRNVATTSTRRAQAPRLVPQQQYPVRYLDPTVMQPWNPPDTGLQYASKTAAAATTTTTTKGAGKRDPLLCGGGDFSSGSDSGVSAGHWTDSDRSPDVRLRDYQATDSGIATPVDDKTMLADLLVQASCGDVRSSGRSKDGHLLPHLRPHGRADTNMPQQKLQPQPAVGVAAVAASCKSCRPPAQYQRLLQQPWAGIAAPAPFQQPAVAVAPGGGRHRGAGRAVEPGPEHTASRRALPMWGRTTTSGAIKRSRTTAELQDVATSTTTGWAQYVVTRDAVQAVWPASGVGKDCSTLPTSDWTDKAGFYGASHCARGATDDSRILWNNESMLRLFQV